MEDGASAQQGWVRLGAAVGPRSIKTAVEVCCGLDFPGDDRSGLVNHPQAIAPYADHGSLGIGKTEAGDGLKGLDLVLKVGFQDGPIVEGDVSLF